MSEAEATPPADGDLEPRRRRSTSDADSTVGPAGWRARLSPHVWPIATLWAVALVLVASYIVSSRPISVIDEYAHLDYVLRMPDTFPASGAPLLPETLETWSCRRMEREVGLPPCDGPHNHLDYPYGGYGLAGAHPPVYYLVTAGVGAVIHTVTPLDQLDSYRAVGVVWLGLSMTASYALALRLGAARSAAVGVILMASATTSTVARSGTVGPDIAAWLMGTLVLLAALTHRGRPRDAVILLSACVLAALTKQTTLLAVGAAMILLVARAPLQHQQPGRGALARRWWRDWLAAVTAAAAFLVPSLSWSAVNASQTVADFGSLEQNRLFIVDGFPATQVLLQAFSFITPVSDGPSSAFMDSTAQAHIAPLAQGILLFGLIAGLALLRTRPRVTALALGIAILLVVGGPLLATANYLASSSFFELKPRYAFPLLAGMIGVAATVLSTRALRLAAVASGAGMVLLVVLQSQFVGIAPPAIGV